MPKIEVHKEAFFEKAAFKGSYDELEALFPAAKAELDDILEDEGLLKIELNDTNRPDLWSAAGLGRQLRIFQSREIPEYDFFSKEGDIKDHQGREVHVDESIQATRPYIVAFAVKGTAIDEAVLKDLIQTQEKLCWNYGRKRRSIAMGVYRSDLMQYPVHYKGADPDKTRFQPLQMEETLSLREILEKHPKGQEYGHIVAKDSVFPFITDAKGDVLSFPPVINSAKIGAVEEGDSSLFIELTGTELDSLLLTANIVACDLADAGFSILPVKTVYPFDTKYGREIVAPYYFQQEMPVELSFANKMLGVSLGLDEAIAAAARMGCKAYGKGETLHVSCPEYRNDFLHAVDLVEDFMIGHGMEKFEPVIPGDFTIGRLSAEEEFARSVKDILIGLGFQEMMYNYLGGRKDYIEKMNIDGKDHIQIANPMTENYEYVRASILPALLASETVSANAVYPHHIFEVGKVAYLDPSENSGTHTANYLGFLSADKDAGFNLVASHISAVFFYVSREYSLEELDDPRFIRGRAAKILCKGEQVGIFGECHPAVLENWGIQMPCTMAEINLDKIM